MAKTKISQFDANAANNTDLNSISIAEGTAPSNINNAIRELMSQLADLNLGNEVLSTLKIDNLHLDGNTIVTLDTNGDLNLTPNGTGSVVVAKVDINGGAIDGTPIGGSSASTGAFTTLSASSTANLGSSVTVSGGNIDGVIGANTPAAITGTVITANTNFAGNLTGNVTGTVDGVVGGTTPAAVTGTTITANTKFVGAIDGNVTATSGTSTFNNVTINGTLDMDSTTSQTITGLATPSGSTDAATKGYVDTEVSGLVDSAPAALNTLNELAAALGDDASFSTTVTNSIAAKLPLAGGTMTGDIDANSNTVSGLKAPSASNDATTKTYVDTADALKLNLSGGTLSGNLAMGSNKVTGLDTPTASGDATTKGYVDGILGSATAAATSASAAATSATASATSATASASSATAAASSATSAAASYDSFDDRYLGAKSSAPTVDNDGDALVTGALYFNTSSNQLFIWSGSAWTQAAFTASGFLSGSNNLSDVDNAGTARTNLGLAIGTNVQAFDADLSALAGLTSAADKGIQFTGSGTAGTYDLTSAGKALLDDADAAAQRTTLGLGSAATLTAGTSANNAVQLDGSAKLPAVDGSALTGLASGGTVNMVADGAISIRKPVVLTAAGKAQEVAESIGSNISVAFTTMDDSDTVSSDGAARMAYDSTSETFVAVYENAASSDYPHAVAGTWSNGTMTWGTPVVLQSASCNREIGIAVGNGKVWTAWARNADTPNIYITSLSISGTAITVATPTDTSIAFSNELGIKLSYDISSDYLLLFNSNQSTGAWLFKVKPYYTTSGGGLTAGTTSTIVTNGSIHANEFDVVYDPDTSRTVVVYTDDSNSNYGTANVIQSSGTTGSPTVTIGSDVVFSGTDAVDGLTATYDTSNDKVFVGYHNTTDGITKGIIGTVTGGGTNSISFAGEGTINDYTNVSSSYLDVVYDSDASKIIVVYHDDDHTSDGLTYRVITSGASSFSVSSAAVITTNENIIESGAAAFGAGKGTAVASRDGDNSQKLSISTLYYPLETNLDNGNYLGIAAEAISDTATGKINVIGGTSTGHSSLTIGNHYFTNGAGTIGLVGNTTGEQYLGRAISATEIQLLENEGYLYGTAEGAVTAGKPVFVEADGDFLMPVSTTTTYTHSKGSDTEVVSTNSLQNISTTYAANVDRFVVSYVDGDDGNKPTVKVVSVGSDNAVAVTATLQLSTTSYEYQNARVEYDVTNEKVLYVYGSGDTSDDLRCKVLTIGASSISQGSEVVIDDSNSTGTDINVCYDTTNSKFVVYTRDQSNSNYPTAYVGSISGTTPSFGTAQVVQSEGATNVYDVGFGGDKFLFTYKDSSTNDGQAVAASLSGTTLSFGTKFEFEDDNILNSNNQDQLTYVEPAGLFVQGYRHSGGGSPHILLALKVASDNSITKGYETGASGSANTNVVYGYNNGSQPKKVSMLTVPIIYRDGSNNIKYNEYVLEEASGENIGYKITKGTEVSLNTTPTNYFTSISQAGAAQNYRMLAAYEDSGNDINAYGIHPAGSVTTTTFPTDGKGFIGIATKDVSDDGQVEVATTGQIDAQQSGLTAGETYFAQNDGSLGTSADTLGSATVGKALSATKILIQ